MHAGELQPRCRPGYLRAVLGLTLAAFAAVGCQKAESVTCPSGRICPKGYTCTPNDDVCIFGPCGNGIVEPDQGENCDDGNKNNEDHCTNNCQSDNTCGNGIKDNHFSDSSRNESCDEGALNGQPGRCSADCKSDGKCGNGIPDNGEDCDYCLAGAAGSDGSAADAMSLPPDGSSDGGDGDAGPDGAAADAGASAEICTLGISESRECNHDCTLARCGDHIRNRAAGEECDEGGETMTCNVDCTLASCGDGKVNSSLHEECDVRGGLDTGNCIGAGTAAQVAGVACHFSECGDGYVNTAAGEECDVKDGADSSDCNGKMAPAGVRCHRTRCGDGYINLTAGETCDALGGGDTRDCNGAAAAAGLSGNKACKAAGCGDGYVNRAAGESCEVPADGADTGTCNGTNAGSLKCTTSLCGDGYINAAAHEDCEPLAGGGDSAGCNGIGVAACKIPTCGDGHLNTLAGETCEVAVGGADTRACNGSNAMQVSCQPASCGDGYTNRQADETCDVLGGVDTAGCNGNHAGTVSCRVPACGDGHINPITEECDDSNVTPGDGCSAICKKEAGFNCPAAGGACTSICGDGVQASTEACDDFNTSTCGTCSGNCRTAQTPAAANGSITVGSPGNGVNFDNDDTFTLSDGIHPLVTFHFSSATPTPASTSTDVFIDTKNANNTQMAGRIASAIQGVGRSLTINAVTSTTNTRQVLLVNSNPGAFGNQNVAEDVTSGNFNVSPMMSGGVGYDCPTAQGCRDGKDCRSGVCSGSHACLAPTCGDGVLNGSETDTDCGGSSGSCARCADGLGCIVDGDCGSDSQCAAGTCITTCGDGNRNGTETDTDCGGGCGPCASGRQCSSNTDCQSLLCGLPPSPPLPDGGADGGGGGPLDAGTTRICM
jgi:cysteine-rich repeat protein